jgi:hypothetical protein
VTEVVWLVDDIAEAALGPVGLLLGVGLGAAALARRRFKPVEDLSVSAVGQAGQSARQLLVGLPALGGLAATVAGLGEWWDDLYAEARAEWQAEHDPAPASPAALGGATSSAEPTDPPGERRRGPNGRFVKRSTG